MGIDFLVNLCVFAANCFWIYQFTKVETIFFKFLLLLPSKVIIE
jgi:hypothetical protein